MKKGRAAAVIAVVTTAVSKAREYARENPDQAAQTVDQVERFLRGKLAAQHGAYVDKGIRALRQGLGLPPRVASEGSGGPANQGAGGPATGGSATVTDPDPDTAEPPVPHGVRDPVAPNPSPGTSDDPQPRRQDDDPAPLTPGERPRR